MSRSYSRLQLGPQVPLTTRLFAGAGLLGLAGLLFVIGFSQTTHTSGALWWKKTTHIPLSERLPALFIAIFLFAIAAVLVVIATRLLLIQGASKKYLAILSSVESMKVQQIARITGTSPEAVYRDIQAMIDSGTLEGFYIDYGAEQVVSKKFLPKESYKTVVTCSGCGNNNEVIVGITKACNFCRQPLVLKKT